MEQRFFKQIKTQYRSYEQAYRKLIEGSNAALHTSKRAIFSFHRNALKDGETLLVGAATILSEFETVFKKEPMLRSEGVYRAAVEEFVEATLFGQFLYRTSLGAVPALREVDPELYIGGMSDLTGELVRYAVARATAHDDKEVARARKTLDEVMEFLIGLDLTGYLRQKYDQAKNSLRRMEEIGYDIALREK